MPHGEIPFGPTYSEMAYPETVDQDIRLRANKAFLQDEFDPSNLFNIHWRYENLSVRRVVMPQALTGVDANIIVLSGKEFPSGSHKVGPAYATLMEGYIDGDAIPCEHTIIAPSTGNFGIGVAYVCRLLGHKSVIIMPENMSKERYDRIKAYGGCLDLTPQSSCDVSHTLKRMYELKQDPANFALAQFELFPNYRFHRHVTGAAVVDACKGIGNERVSCFVSAPGSGGTIAAGEHVKTVFPESKTVAAEPYECSTLATGMRGQHRVQGIADKKCCLIHNVLATDFVITVSDEDCVRGLKLVRDGASVLENLGLDPVDAVKLRDLFGVSGICNLLAAIRMSKYLRLGPNDNVVTIATDGFDRYGSVLADMEHRYLEISDGVMYRWARDIFFASERTDMIYDFRRTDRKEHLFTQKAIDWIPFGYTEQFLDRMRSRSFWEDEYSKVEFYDEKIKALR